MVVTWFLAQLAVSNFVIGLMGPMRMVLWYIPQIVVSSYLQRQPYKMPGVSRDGRIAYGDDAGDWPSPSR